MTFLCLPGSTALNLKGYQVHQQAADLDWW